MTKECRCDVITSVDLSPELNKGGLDDEAFVTLAIAALCDSAAMKIRSGAVPVPKGGGLILVWQREKEDTDD